MEYKATAAAKSKVGSDASISKSTYRENRNGSPSKLRIMRLMTLAI